MTEHLTDVDKLPVCGHCQRPIHPSDSRRHFGVYVAHGEGRCVQLLQMEIERLQLENDTCGLECSATLKSLVAENERLRTCLTGISTCSTCEACRGAALRALGERTVAEINAAVDERLDRVERELGAPSTTGEGEK